MKLNDYPTAAARRHALEEELHVNLQNLGAFPPQAEAAAARNCENLVGYAQVPVGVAGPLRLLREDRDGERPQHDYYLPLATTEAALVASVNRGCKILTVSGGAIVRTERVGMTRAPVFVVDGIRGTQRLLDWVNDHSETIRSMTESTSTHLTLLRVEPKCMGRNVFLKFYFDTQDAMGMNMVTIAIANVVPTIERETGARCIAVSGNLCVDKKSNFSNFMDGRGYRVWAECVIPSDVMTNVLKASIDGMLEVQLRKVLYGSAMAGTIGFNAHHANILTAIFIATGQDVAQVSESAIGMTTIEKHDESLYISVFLPDLPLGTVGGGTGLATQNECLALLGVNGGNNGNNARELAGIVGGAVLAGEISILASLAANTLAASHKRFARAAVAGH